MAALPLVVMVLLGSVSPGAATTPAQVETAVDAAETWLLSQQQLGGGFGAWELAPRDTASAVLALAGRASAEPGLTQAAVYLAGTPESNTPFHARRALALRATDRNADSLLAELLVFENGGGYGAFRAYHSNLLDTALAVEALALDEATYLLEINGLLDYLQLHQRGDGGWSFVAGDASATSDLYYTAEILAALATPAQLVVGEAVIDSASVFLATQQLADGGFGDPLSSAIAYRALLQAGKDDADLPFGSPVASLLTSQQGDGSWEGDVYTTAEVVRALRRHRADLAVTEMTTEPTSAVPGEPLDLSVTVRNRGSLEAPASRLAIHRDADDGPLVAELDVPALLAGAESTVSTPVDTSGVAGPFLDLIALADSDEVLDEPDEDDNRGFLRLDLASPADWAVASGDLETVPVAPLPDTSFDLVAAVRNLGESTVPSTPWELVRTVAGVDQEVLASGNVGPLDGGASTTLVVPLSFAEGEHAVTLRLDPADGLAELREDNNQGSRMLAVFDPDRADLSFDPASWLVDPAVPQPGDTVTVSVEALNLGARDATVTLDLLAIGATGPVAPNLASQSSTLVAGGSAVLSASFTMPAEAHSLEAVADPGDLVAELDEANNRDRRVLRPLADLVVGLDNLEIAPAEPLAGETVTVRATVRNAGFLTADTVDVAVYDGAPGADPPIFEQTLTSVPAAGNRGIEFPWVARAGASELVVVVDPADTVAELLEANNQARRELAVPRATGPDLRVESIDRAGLSEDPLARRLDGTVVATLVNAGDAPAVAPFTVRVFADLDGDGRRSEGEPELASALVESDLAVGDTTTTSLTIDATVAFHRALAWIEVDALDTVAEQREDDNLAPLGVVCEEPAPVGSLDPQVEWWLPGVEIETAPLVVQLTDDNGDGRVDSRDTPDVVFLGEDAEGRGVFARDGLDGSEHWTFRSSAAHPLPFPIGNPAAADLDGDGIAEVIVPRRDGRLMALDARGEILWVGDKVEEVGERWAGGIAVGDLDGDGTPEIAVGRSVLSHRGELLALGTGNRGRNENYYSPLGVALVPGATGYAHSLIADLDLDGQNELIAGDTVYRLEGGQLLVVWDYDEPGQLMVDGFSAVAQLDGDPEAEVVVVSSNAVLVLEHDGTVARTRRTLVPFAPLTRATFWGGPPTVADLDGDGQAEILVTGDTELVAFRADLSVFWRAPFDDVAAITGVGAFDFDGDGVREVVALDNQELTLRSGLDGSVLWQLPNTSKTASELPVVADVDGDGRAEILLPSNVGFDGDASTQGLRVLGDPSWQATRPIWNQHGYRPGHVQLDGTVPSAPLAGFSTAGGNGFRTNPERPAPTLVRPNATLSWPRIGTAGAEGLPIVLRLGNGGLGTLPADAVVELHEVDPGLGGSAVTTVNVADGLRPGAWVDIELAWTAAAPVGTVAWARVVVPTEVGDCLADDDVLSFPLDLELLPDLGLAPDGFGVAGSVAEGQLVPVALTVRNRGSAASIDNLARLVLGDPFTGPVVAEATIPALEPGAETVVDLAWDTTGLAAGSYALYALLDADDTVAESNEDDNLGLATVAVGAGSLPDPSLEVFDVASGVVAGDVVPVTLTVQNRGTDLVDGLVVALRANGAEVARSSDPATLPAGASRTLVLDLETLGRIGVLELEAVIDPDGTVGELDELNNSASAELEVLPSPLSVQVTPDRLGARPGETVAIDLAMDLTGAETVDATLDVRVLDSVGALVASLDSASLTLSPGTTPRTTSWEVGESFPGVYTVLAELRVDGALRARGVAGVSVAADLEATARLVADRNSYGAGDVATFTVSLRNEGANTVLQGTRSELVVVDASFVEHFRSVRDLPDLVPGGGITFEVPWALGTTPPGSFAARLVLRDLQGIALAGSEISLTLEDSAQDGQGLRGTVTLDPSTVGVGAVLAPSFELSHQGNAELLDLGLRLDLLALPGTETVVSAGRTIDLSLGQTLTGTELLATAGLAPGTYLLELVASPPAGEVRLDTAVVRVERGVRISDAVVDEGDGGTALLRFDVALEPAADTAVSVDLATTDATALATEDYQSQVATVTFAPGETLRTFEVAVLGDLDIEGDETLLVFASNPDGGGEPIQLADGVALGTIRDEEGCGGPELLVEPGFEGPAEGPVETLDPAWSVAGGPWSRHYEGAAEGRAVLGATAAGEVAQEIDLATYASAVDAGEVELVASVLTAGDLAAQAQLVLDLLAGDGSLLASEATPPATAGSEWGNLSVARTAPAGTRRARLRLVHGGAGDGSQATLDFDHASLKVLGLQGLFVDDLAVLEGDGAGGQAVVRIALACAAESPVTVDWTTADGTGPDAALAGNDYNAAAGTASFALGESEVLVSFDLLGDILDESDETLTIVLSDPTGTAPPLLDPSATVTILDDDGLSEISVAAPSATEDAGATLDFVVTLSSAAGRPVQVSYTTVGDTAAVGADFEGRSGTLVFSPGETSKTISVPLVDDDFAEGTETLRLELSNPVDALLVTPSVVGQLLDDDIAELSIDHPLVLESDGSAVFTLRLSAASTRPVEVTVTTVDGEALAGSDYTATSTRLTLPVGSRLATVAVPLLDDGDAESRETFRLVLSDPLAASLAVPEGTATVVDDDGLLLSVGDLRLRESDADQGVSVSVLLSQPSTGEVTVTASTVDGTAEAGLDYQATTTDLVFPPGTVELSVPVTVLGDDLAEDEEYFFLVLSNAVGAELAAEPGRVSLRDDDRWQILRDARQGSTSSCFDLVGRRFVQFESGAVWNRQTLDLGRHFDKTFQMRFGARELNGGGVVFVLQDEGLGVVGIAGDGTLKGYNGIAPSIGVEFDHRNPDHVAVDLDGSSGHHGHPPVNLPAPLADGQSHEVRVIWNEVSKDLSLSYDGQHQLTMNRDLVESDFAGDPAVFWGFTAAYGTSGDLFSVCVLDDCAEQGEETTVSIGDVRFVEGDSGSRFADLPLTLACPRDTPVTVSVATADGTALVDEDYRFAAETVVFAPGETSKTIRVEVLGDTLPEPDEVFHVDITSVDGAAVRHGRANVTILSDEITASLDPTRLTESDAERVWRTSLVLDSPVSQSTTLQYQTVDGTAVAGSDYEAKSGSVTLAPGASHITLFFDILGDTTHEADETFFVDILAPEGSLVDGRRVEVTLGDDDTCAGPNLLQNASFETVVEGVHLGWTVVEGGTWVTSSIGGAQEGGLYTRPREVFGEMRQDVDVSGFAQRIDDGRQTFAFEGWVRVPAESPLRDQTRLIVEYRDATNTQVLDLFDSGERTHTTWTWVNDHRVAPPGTRFVRVRMLGTRRTGSSTDTRFDNLLLRTVASPAISAGDVTVSEGEAGSSQAIFPVTLSCPSDGTVRVDYLTSDGSATASEDYQATFGTLSFPVGASSATIAVPILGDTLTEGDEIFWLDLVNPRGSAIARARAQGTIVEDEVQLSVGDAVVDESAGAMVFTLDLDRASGVDVRVDVATLDGEARADEDYAEVVTTVVIPAGEISTQVVVPILDDTVSEPASECFVLELSNPIHAALEDPEGLGCIQDDDRSLSIADASVAEGDLGTVTASFRVTLSRASATSITVDWATSDDTATAPDDYVAAAGQVSFAPGETESWARVEVVGDTTIELTELFTVTLTNPVGAGLLDGVATGFVIDDDDCQGPTLLANGGAEAGVDGSNPEGWTAADGTWSRFFDGGSVIPRDGFRYLSARAVGAGGEAELYQEVDVTAFAPWIDAGRQRFQLEAWVRSVAETDPDPARVVVEYRAADGIVLDTYDSGEIVRVDAWQPVADLRTPPVGTRTVRTRLLTRQGDGSATGASGAYFDLVSLRPAGTPVVWVSDPTPSVEEGDLGAVDLGFEVTLSCTDGQPVTVDFATSDGGGAADQRATAGLDYTTTTGSHTFEVGHRGPVEIVVPVLGDGEREPAENLTLTLSNPAGAVLREAVAVATIVDNDTPIDSRTYVTLQTAPGDGQVSIDLGAHGDWGHQIIPPIVGPDFGVGEALFDPPGAVGPSGTTYEAALMLRRSGYPQTFLTHWILTSIDVSQLPNPGFVEVGERHAVSVFAIHGLFVELRQSLHDVVVDGERVGGVLVQEYDLTNRIESTTGFEIIRLIDGDIDWGSGTGFADGGGRRVIDGVEMLFETDVPVAPGEVASYFAITSELGDPPTSGRYEVYEFPDGTDLLRASGVPGNSVVADGDGDGFVDVGQQIDVGMMLREVVPTLGIGETVTYRTLTFFGAAVIDDLTLDLPPTADAGGQQATFEGAAVVLDASASSDFEGPIAAYDWDLDGDGLYGEPEDASGVTATLTPLQEGAVVVGLRVTDGGGNTAFDTATVVVVNAPPAVTVGDGNSAPEDPFQLLAVFADPGVLDTHTASIDWGDGSPVETGSVVETGGSGTVSGSHVYADEGTYIVTVCVTDDAGDAGCGSGLVLIETGGDTTVCDLPPFDAEGDSGPEWTLDLLGDADQGSATVVGSGVGAPLHLEGDGTSLYHSGDHGAFYHREISAAADFRIEVDITDFPVDTGGQLRKAALMLRTGLDPWAPRVMVTFVPHIPGATPDDPAVPALQFDARLTDGGSGVEIGNTVFGDEGVGVPFGTRLAIEKRGDVATVYYSHDGGTTWIRPVDATYHGSATIDWSAAGETLLAGVMVASYDSQVTVTAEAQDFAVCRPGDGGVYDPPAPPTCDPAQPVDALVFLDVSGSMTAGFEGAASKLSAAQAAIQDLLDGLAARGDGSRAALVGYAGHRTVAENLAGVTTLLSTFTSDLAAVESAALGIDGSTLDPGTPTALALALDEVLDTVVPGFDPAHQPAVFWLSDGIANIDAAGRGPDVYALEALQDIALGDGAGGFRSWSAVGWSGDFNPEIGTFDGEPLANAMFALERLDRSVPEVLVYGLALEGDGSGLGTSNSELLVYGAHVSGGRAFVADDLTTLLASTSAVATDLVCGGGGSAVLAGRVWNDRDGDGIESTDTSAMGEPGLGAVRVDLFDDAGLGVTSQSTADSGTFTFGELPAGTYTVQVDATTLPVGDGGEPVDVATHDADGIATVDTVTLTVVEGELRSDVDFGYQERDPAPPEELCELDGFDTTLDPSWLLAELGDADQGLATVVAGELHLTGDGTSLFHGDDNGAFLHRLETDGDFRVTTRITAVPDDAGGPVRKGCLMVRRGDGAGSGTGVRDPRVMACYIPGLPGAGTAGLQFDVRHADGTAEELATVVLNATLPVELAIESEAGVVRVEYRYGNGGAWTQPGGLLGGTVALDLGTDPHVGLMVASYDADITTTVAFDDFEVCRPNPAAP